MYENSATWHATRGGEVHGMAHGMARGMVHGMAHDVVASHGTLRGGMSQCARGAARTCPYGEAKTRPYATTASTPDIWKPSKACSATHHSAMPC